MFELERVTLPASSTLATCLARWHRPTTPGDTKEAVRLKCVRSRCVMEAGGGLGEGKGGRCRHPVWSAACCPHGDPACPTPHSPVATTVTPP